MEKKKISYLGKSEMRCLKGGHYAGWSNSLGGYVCNYIPSFACIKYIDEMNHAQYLNLAICNGCAAKRIGTGGGGGGPIDNPGVV